MAFIETLSMALVTLFVASAEAQVKLRPLVFTVGPEEVVATRAELTRVVPTNPSWPDSPLGVVKVNEGRYWFMGSGADMSGSPGFVQGTLDHLVSGNLVYSVSPVLDSKTKRPIVPERYTYAGSGPFYVEPRSGWFIQFTHLENTFGNAQQQNVGPYYTSLGLTVSKNRGKTWHFVCEIVRPIVSFSDFKAYVQKDSSAPWLDVGAGSHVVVDDKGIPYFYVYFADYPYPAGSNCHLAVARAKVADVVSAVAKGECVAWKKYYKNGWDEPAIGGKSSPVESGHAPIDIQVDVKYNSYLKQYILASGSIKEIPGYLELTTSKDGIHWAPRTRVAESLTPDYQQSVIVYPSIIGSDSDPTIPGKTFYIYSTKHSFETDLLEVTRRKITLR
jgi:hypothetical protein